jgi:nitroreductase
VNSELMNVILRRRSVRAFSSRPVPRELILECVEAARYAPSACHVQPWRFVVIDDPEVKGRLAGAAFTGLYSATRFAASAPALVVILTRFDWFVQRAGKRIQGTHYHLLDAGIAGEHFVLRAAELGLGSCWIGWYSRRGVRKALELRRSYRVCALLALGWPAEDLRFSEKVRKDVREIAAFNEVKFLND